MGRSKKSGTGKKRANMCVSTNHAPTMQGMQQVDTWNLMQIVPVTIDPTVYNPDEPASIQFAAGANRWAWETRQLGSFVNGQSLAYGEFTEQFAELAALWSTYRLDSVEAQFIPSQTGAGQQTATVSAIDPAGSSDLLEIADLLLEISRLRSVKLTDSRKVCHRRVDFRQWLTQCAPQPFLQTVDLTLATGVREQYPQDTANVLPVIRMAFQSTPGVTATNGLVLGFFRINARYSVRGRRSKLLDVSMRLMLFTPQEREEATRILIRQLEQKKEPLSARHSLKG